ncbi:MAG: iron-sulfur cluster assembly scaffold protein [Candidatus Aminicenantes bacterium]|nr:iron-sulfur cluster assembly scaffold protein [Candidatus Aminicenantes bacterium]
MSEKQNIDKFAQSLQTQILEQLKKQYTKEVIDRWQNPHNFRRMENPDGQASAKGSCGDTMEMFVKIKNDRIVDCSFQTDGCGTTIACGSAATDLAMNKSFTEALGTVSAGEILKILGGLPPADVHCAQLAAEAMRRALADYLYHKRQGWKKYYRKD